MDGLYQKKSEYLTLRDRLENVDKYLCRSLDNVDNIENLLKNSFTINSSSAAGNSLVYYHNDIVETINFIRLKLIPEIDREVQKINNQISNG